MSIYRCLVLTVSRNVRDFKLSRTKRIVNAFLNIVTLPPDFAAMFLCIMARREQVVNLCDWCGADASACALSDYDFRRIAAKVINFLD